MKPSMNLNTDPVVSAKHPSKYLGVFGMLWVTFLIIGVFTAVKTFAIGPVVFSVSILAYPFTYLFADIFTEVYGYRVTRRIVWTGFVCILIASVTTYLYSIVPPNDSFAEYDQSFSLVFKSSPVIALAAIISFFSGELTNSFVLAKLKIFTKGKLVPLRLITSTFAGQFIDNTIFFVSAFLAAGWYKVEELFPLVMSSVLFCTIWETIALPLTFQIIRYIKHKEGLDTYDHGTNFNPFSLKS